MSGNAGESKNQARLLLIHDARWSNPLNIRPENFQCLHFFIGDIIRHDDSCK